MAWYDRCISSGVYHRRKLRSQTSDNMGRWKSRGGKRQRREEKKREDHPIDQVRQFPAENVIPYLRQKSLLVFFSLPKLVNFSCLNKFFNLTFNESVHANLSNLQPPSPRKFECKIAPPFACKCLRACPRAQICLQSFNPALQVLAQTSNPTCRITLKLGYMFTLKIT